jgi:type IV pilus assembly protein PilE
MIKPINSCCVGYRGFSLIELMIVVTLAGILVSLATPSYRKYVMRAHRTEAIGKMLQVAACQERIYAASGSYDTGLCLMQSGEYYELEYSAPDISDTGRFTVLATPVGPQTSDPCGTLFLDQLGTRTVGNEAGDPVKCWSGR